MAGTLSPVPCPGTMPPVAKPLLAPLAAPLTPPTPTEIAPTLFVRLFIAETKFVLITLFRLLIAVVLEAKEAVFLDAA